MNLTTTMEIYLRIFTITLTLSVCTIFCFPSRPLNERSKELAWQAWLLVDDQNQSKQSDQPELYMRRRITPKSVFIAPTFSPDKLPACAEGYQSDVMGRCIQIIKIDQEKHLSFLLERLNAQFGDLSNEDEDTVEENASTPGPFQLNIPLKTNDENQETYYGNPDIAIIVAPTNGDYDSTKLKRTHNVETTNKIDVRKTHKGNNDEDDSKITTTIYDSTTTAFTTDTFETTTTMSMQFDETNPTEMTTEATTTSIDDGTAFTEQFTTMTEDYTDETTESSTEMMQALFFLDRFKSSTRNKTFDYQDLPNVSNLNSGIRPISIGNRMKIDDVHTGNDEETFKDPHLQLPADQEAKPSQTRRTNDNLLSRSPLLNFHTYQHLPNPNLRTQFKTDPNVDDEDQTKRTTNSQIEFESLFQDYVINRAPDLKSNERHIFKNRRLFSDRNSEPNTNVDNLSLYQSNNNHRGQQLQHNYPNHQQQQQDQSQQDERQAGTVVYNHRNRDKNLWNIPSDWVDINPNKPIVLKFTNKPTRQTNENTSQNRQKSEGIYREVPPEELSYIFGGRRLPRNNR